MEKLLDKIIYYLNWNLGYLNWIIFPIKMLLFLLISLATRLCEPYKKPGSVEPETPIDRVSMYIDRLSLFNYHGCQIFNSRCLPIDGKNFDWGDWCLEMGLYVAYLSHANKVGQAKESDLKAAMREYVLDWLDEIDHKIYLKRGVYWDNGVTINKYKISMDQIAGFVYGLSCVPQDMFSFSERNRIVSWIRSIYKDNYCIDDPEDGRSYWRDFRFGIIAYGQTVPLILAILKLGEKLAWETSDRDFFLREYKKRVRWGGLFFCNLPMGKLFERINDFVWNVTLLSLCALDNLEPSKSAKRGIKWIWWINRRVYNPYWMYLAHFHTECLDTDELNIAARLLNSVDETNFYDWAVEGFPDVTFWKTPAKARRYFRVFGKKYYDLPLRYSQRLSDVLLFQRIERQCEYHGIKTEGVERSDDKYVNLNWLNSYFLYKNIK